MCDFLNDRKLLADLSRCTWESLKAFLMESTAGVVVNTPVKMR